MRFEGLRDYRTGDSGQLREDLQRQNEAVGKSLAELERECAPRPTVRFLAHGEERGSSGVGVHSASYDEMLVLLGPSERVELPRSSSPMAGRAITIVVAASPSTVTIASADSDKLEGDRVMGTGVEVLTTMGLRTYIDDGNGGWWRAP